jgi:2-polyprenyl-3-methyl-5-hydroxy-6-metoxy-1,4-benzoquinol methylase
MGCDSLQRCIIDESDHPQMKDIDYSIYYREFHDGSIENYQRVASWMKRRLLPTLPPAKDSRILDIGCGFGFCVYTLNELGYKNSIGIDISAQQVKQGRDRGLNLVHVRDSISWLGCHRDSFDHIILFDVLEHIPKDQQIDFLEAALLSLKPHCFMHLRVPNANSIVSSRWRYNDFTHHTTFTESSANFVLLNAGFTSVVINDDAALRSVSKRLWRKDARRGLKRHIIRWLWRHVYAAELGNEALGRSLHLDLDLDIVAGK